MFSLFMQPNTSTLYIKDLRSVRSGYRNTVGLCLTGVLMIATVDLVRILSAIQTTGSHWMPMELPAAMNFILSALGIGCVFLEKQTKHNRKYLLRICSLLVISISSIAFINGYHPFFFQHVPVFIHDSFSNSHFTSFMHIHSFTAINFLFVGLMLYSLSLPSNIKYGIAHSMILPVVIISFLFILGLLLKVHYIAGLKVVPDEPTTSIAFVLFCISVLFVRANTWLMNVYTAQSIGGIIARRITIPLMITPLIIGWFRIKGERMGMVQSEEGVILVSIVYLFISAFLVWLIARFANRMDRLRKIADNALLKSNARLEILSDVAGKLLESDNPQLIVDDLCKKVMHFLDCQFYFHYLIDTHTNRLLLSADAGIPNDKQEKYRWLDMGDAICGCVARDGKRIIIDDVTGIQYPRTTLVESLGIKAYACHPLISDNKVIGTLSFGTGRRTRFTSDDLSLMKIVTDQVAIAMSRIRHQNELRESEDRFRTIAESLPVLISITRKSDATIRFTNNAWDEAFSYRNGAATGKKAEELYFNLSDRKQVVEILNKEGTVNNLETQVRKPDGSGFWVMASIRPLVFEGEPAFLGAMLNISDRKKEQEELLQLNRTLKALRKSGQIMIHAENESQYLNEVCKIIIQCGHLMVWIGYAQHDEQKSVVPVAYHGFDRGYIDQMNISWANNERGKGPTGTAIRTGKPSVCRNMHNDPDFAPWREEALKRGYTSSVVLPLIIDGKAFGAISIYSRQPDAFSNQEIVLLSDLANDLAYGISNIRLILFEKQATKAIRESEKKYRLLFDTMTEGFALNEIINGNDGKPFDFKYISVNPAFEKHTGIKAKDILGKTVMELWAPREQFWIDCYIKVATLGESMEIEGYVHSLERSFRMVFFCPEKGIIAIIIENITDRINAQRELQRTKNYLENLINFANAPIIVWNTHLQIQLFNHAFERLTGFSVTEVEGKNLDMLFPEQSLPESTEKIKETNKVNLDAIEIPILTKNGEIRTILWNSANIYDADNTTIISTIAQGNDITDRTRAEQKVISAMEKLDLTLENANICTWEWEITPNIFTFDDKFSGLSGTHAGAEGMRIEEFEKYIYEDDIPHLRRAIRNSLYEGSPFDTLFRIRHFEDNDSYINAKARIEKDKAGNPLRMAGVFIDITEMKKRTDQTLFHLNEDLLRSNKELEQFAYVASHDLQEPLRMISSFTQLLARKYHDKLDDEAREFIKYAVEGAIRMQKLINDLLEFSRVKTRGKTPVLVDMRDILAQTVNNLDIKIKEKNAQITHDPLPLVKADPGQMTQLMQNLLDNALKFCNGQPTIHISSVEEHGLYVFAVKDNGIGVEPQYYDRIFQIFQRLHHKTDYGGTGIGLALCKRITERHGGKIWVEPNDGQGTIVKFTIQKT